MGIYICIYIYIWGDCHTVLENRMYYAFLFRFLSVNLISIGYIHIYPAQPRLS